MKIVWVVVSCWVVAAMVLASCAPAAPSGGGTTTPTPSPIPTPSPTPTPTPKEPIIPEVGSEMMGWTGTKLNGATVRKMIEKPQYGGTYVRARDDESVYWDTAISGSSAWADNFVTDQLFDVDWTRGPVGTEEWSGAYDLILPVNMIGESLAESWERPDPKTLKFKIRKGVHFGLDPDSEASQLVGGRQMTAEDVAYTLRYMYAPAGYLGRGYTKALLRTPDDLEASIHVAADDPWTVVMELSDSGIALSGELIGNWGAHFTQVVPHEVFDKYGTPLNDWHNLVGTGPFFLKDNVSGSVMTYVKNPDYWKHDPFFPENQLPYVDTVKYLIIPDISTMLAGMRSGKIDNIEGGLLIEDANSVLGTNPEIRSKKFLVTGVGMAFRNDVAPFNDVNVRRALNMAINKQEMVDDLYGGEAELFNFIIPPYPILVQAGAYVPLEEMPESVQELYKYQPDRAKQLLAEAGYPNGFQTEVIAWSKDMIETAEILKNYWSKIGVDLTIDVKEVGVFNSLWGRKAYNQGIMYGSVGSAATAYVFLWIRKDSRFNTAVLNIPLIEDTIMPELRKLYWEDTYLRGPSIPLGELFPNLPEAQGMPSLNAYANENAFYITLPKPYGKILWQPWLKNFEGAQGRPGYGPDYVATYLWIDQGMKQSAGR